jgi:hypothetical protein
MKGKNKIVERKLPKGFKINKALNGKYDDDPFFIEKAKKAEELIKKVGLPNF